MNNYANVKHIIIVFSFSFIVSTITNYCTKDGYLQILKFFNRSKVIDIDDIECIGW